MPILKNWDPNSLKNFELIPQYWESLKPQSNVDDAVVESWKKKVELMDDIAMQNNVVIFLWNPFTNRFLHMSDQVRMLIGIDPALYLAEDGVAYSFTRFYPPHLEGCMQLNQHFITYYSKNNITDHRSIQTSFNFLYRNGAGKYIQVIQRAVILETDENNMPKLILDFVYDAGHIKRHESVGGLIIGPDEIQIIDFDEKTNTIQEPKVISAQELKIIRLLANGLDTKAIAEELSISPLTVSTHRRNLIKKTDCLDSTAVVTYARMIGLI